MGSFVDRVPENGDLNQYWYSPATIATLVAEVESSPGSRVAFLSTPSIYFSLPRSSPARRDGVVFDLDEQFGKDANYVKYDFRRPDDFPEAMRHSFDMVVVDPPFITRDVWELYAQSIRSLLKQQPRGDTDASSAPSSTPRILLTTVAESAPWLASLLNVKPRRFKPSIPHLVYQYAMYTNYESDRLDLPNPEIPEDD